MNRASKIIVSVVVAGLVALVGAGLYAWHWWGEHSDELVKGTMAAFDEGRKAGTSTDERGCMHNAFEQRERRDKDPKVFNQMRLQLWLVSCLDAAQALPEFCAEVPAADNPFKLAWWSNAECVKRGDVTTECAALYQSQGEYCSSNERRAKLGVLKPEAESPASGRAAPLDAPASGKATAGS